MEGFANLEGYCSIINKVQSIVLRQRTENREVNIAIEGIVIDCSVLIVWLFERMAL